MMTPAEAASLVKLAEEKVNESVQYLRWVKCQAPFDSHVRMVCCSDLHAVQTARPRFFWLRLFLQQHGWNSEETSPAVQVTDELPALKGAVGE